MCKVVNITKEKCDVLIKRPSKWGNPYSHRQDTTAQFQVSTREEAIQKYEEYLLNNSTLMNSLYELRNKKLGCVCSPLPCHGDILKKYVDRLEEKETPLF